MKCPSCQTDNPETSRFCADCGTRLTVLHESPDATETRTLPPMLDLETGTIFADRYQVIEKLGSGGMGRVYKVFDKKVKEKIALKLIRPEIASDPKTIERFEHELRVARSIAHRNVCRTFDLGESGGTHFITMEYVPGETLKNIIRMTGPLSVGTAIHYAQQIADGLEEARRHGIVHRDLKPQNVLIDPSGTARIMDFGIARSLQAKEWTGEGVVIGTPEYMSPEQAEGEEVDHRTDIYALGVILYEMTTGKVPFEGRTPLSVIVKQKTTPPHPPREINPQIPESLERLILKCLDKDRTRRFQTAADLRAALDQIEADLPATGSHGAAAKSPFAVRRRAVRIALLGIIILALTAGTYLLVRKPGTSPAQTPALTISSPTQWTKSIAVLPFEVVGRDREKETLGEGLADGVRTKLMSIPELRVIFKNSSDAFSGTSLSPSEIGKKLQVDNILRGRYRATSSGIGADVDFISASSGQILWTRSYEEPMAKNFFQMEDRIVIDVAAELGFALDQGRLTAAKKYDMASVEALEAAIEGRRREYAYRESGSDKDFSDAVHFFQTALQKEPNGALAYWSLGNLYEARYVKTNAINDWLEMRKNFKAALDKNPGLAEVHLGMGWVYFYEGNLDQAYESYKKAYEIAPNDADVNFNTASFLRSIGLDQKAVRYYIRGMMLDPRSLSGHLNCSTSYWNLGNFAEGLRLLEEALVIDPKSYHLHANYIRFLLETKDLAKAEKELGGIEKILPNTNEARGRRDRLFLWFYALKGNTDKARALLESITEPYRYEVTNADLLLGEKDKALDQIKTGAEQGFILIKDSLYPYSYLITNPFFDGLQTDPRFEEIKKQAKATFESRQSRYNGL